MKTIFKTGMQKFILLTTAIIFTLSCAGDIYASEGIKLTASEVEGGKGDQVVVEIKAENAAGTEGGQFLLNFDPALVEPVSAEAGALVEEAESNLFMINREYAEGQLKFMWVTALADTADSGAVCEITFDLLDEGSAALEFSEIIISPDEIETAEAVSGKINIEDAGVDKEENEVEPEEDVTENDDVDEEVAAAEADTSNNTLLIVIIVAVAAAGGYVAFRKFRKTAKD